jgi:hypothetical protein
VLAVIAAACGGGGDNLVEPTVVIPATVQPSSTVQPNPTETVTPTVVPSTIVGSSYVTENFPSDAVSDRYIDLYMSLLSERVG